MRLTTFTSAAFLITACGSQSATVGERLDGVEDQPDGGTNGPTINEPTAVSTELETSVPPEPTSDTPQPGASSETILEPGTTDSIPSPADPPIVAAEPCADPTPLDVAPADVVDRLTNWLGVEADEALLLAQNNGGLDTYGQVECQARRLTQLPEHRLVLREFLGSWLQVDDWQAAFNSNTSTAVNEQMVDEARAFVDDVAIADSPTLGTLLSGNERLLGPDLADHYGVQLPDAGTATVAVPGQHGFFTLGLLTSTTSRIGGRGDWILRQFACLQVGAPLPEFSSLAQPTETTTYREAHDQAIEPAHCVGCHVLLDGAGYALENFDAQGRYQAEESGKPIDASGAVNFGGTETLHDYVDVVNMSAIYTTTEPVRVCLAEKILGHAQLRDTDGNISPLDRAKAASHLLQADVDLRDLFVAATQVASFWE